MSNTDFYGLKIILIDAVRLNVNMPRYSTDSKYSIRQ